MTFIKEMKNEECNSAIKRIFDKIDMEKINNFIDSIECLSNVRKEFYKNIIEKRYLILEKTNKQIWG